LLIAVLALIYAKKLPLAGVAWYFKERGRRRRDEMDWEHVL